MKKSQLRQLIKEEIKNVKEYYDDGEESQGGIFSRGDGWNKETLGEAGVMDWLVEVESISYEIKNGRRGSYSIDGDSDSDLFDTFKHLHDSLGNVLNSIDSMIG